MPGPLTVYSLQLGRNLSFHGYKSKYERRCMGRRVERNRSDVDVA